MNRRPRALIRPLLAAVVLAGSSLIGLDLAGPAAAAALPIGQCTTTSGVILAVDFAPWGGPLERGCGSTPTTGYQLLNQGGWQSYGDARDGQALVCRISYAGFDGGAVFPTRKQQACATTPPASAYWSYWHADPGQSTWAYSQQGAMSYQPKPGSVDLWTFGGTNTSGSSSGPPFSPDSVRATNATPTGGTTPAPPAPHPGNPQQGTLTQGSAGHGTSGRGSAAGVGTAGAGTSAGSAASALSQSHPPSPGAARSGATSAAKHPPKTGAQAAHMASGTAAGQTAPPPIVDAPPVAAARHTSGSLVPELVTAVLVLAIGGAAAVTGWRRRRAT